MLARFLIQMNKMPKAGRILADMIRDAAGLGAVASISYGAWRIYEPAGFIVGGVLVLAGVFASSLGQSHSPPSGE